MSLWQFTKDNTETQNKSTFKLWLDRFWLFISVNHYCRPPKNSERRIKQNGEIKQNTLDSLCLEIGCSFVPHVCLRIYYFDAALHVTEISFANVLSLWGWNRYYALPCNINQAAGDELVRDLKTQVNKRHAINRVLRWARAFHQDIKSEGDM